MDTTKLVYDFTIPDLRLESLSNSRLHWARKAEYNASVRVAIEYAALAAGLGTAKPLDRARVTITRIAPRKISDRDNLYAAVKPVLDALKSRVCAKVGGRKLWVDRWGLLVEDDMERVELVALQEQGPYSVRIKVEAVE